MSPTAPSCSSSAVSAEIGVLPGFRHFSGERGFESWVGFPFWSFCFGASVADLLSQSHLWSFHLACMWLWWWFLLLLMFCLPRILPEPVFFCFLFFCGVLFCLIFFPKALESLYLSTTGSDWTDNEHWVCALMLWDFPFFMTDFSLL